MLVYPETKIYVLCPGNNRSSTADICHELCAALINFGVEVFMVYLPANDNFNPANPVDEIYQKYNIPYDNGVIDTEKNILIAPEIAANFLYFTKKTRRIIFWLNVHSFLRDIAIKTTEHFDEILNRPMPKFFSFNHYDSDIEHWAQSEYARQFLKINGVADEKIFTVTDFINPKFFDAPQIKSSAKKNIVAYRQIKDSDFTDIVQALTAEFKWQPVESFAPESVQKLFGEAKIYVDFGDHPAKGKLVREAAILNCVTLTGKHGAAANDIDINISDEFKFEETIDNAVKAGEKIKAVMKNFDAELSKQNNFREKVLREKNLFFEQIKTALNLDKN